MKLFSNRTFLSASIISISTFLGCATGPTKNKWTDLASNKEFQREKQVYIGRMGNMELCLTTGVSTFLTATEITPNRQCMYPSSPFSRQGKGYKILKVAQVTQDGFLVQSPYAGHSVNDVGYEEDHVYGAVVFIHKTDEPEVVDGSFLDDAGPAKLYVYAGPYSYKTLVGSKTVHSFKKLPEQKLGDALKGLKYYEPLKEFYIKQQAWDRLEDLEAK